MNNWFQLEMLALARQDELRHRVERSRVLRILRADRVGQPGSPVRRAASLIAHMIRWRRAEHAAARGAKLGIRVSSRFPDQRCPDSPCAC